MEQLSNGYTLKICEDGFPLSTDSIALADFVKLPKNAQVLDLGAGCGTLGMLLCAKDNLCQVTGLELQENSHLTALENARDNQLEDRLTSICTDLTQIPSDMASRFSVCVSNPPYFAAGPAGKRTTARREDLCSPQQLFASAGRALRWGGDFYLVHRPERLAQLCACAAGAQLEPKRLCLIRHKANGPVSLILLQCRKGGKPGLLWQEEALFQANGEPTDYYRRLYHL